MDKPKPFVRKSFVVSAIRVSRENLLTVAGWCDSGVRSDDDGRDYVNVEIGQKTRQRTPAYIGDWVTCGESGCFKVYTDVDFQRTFKDSPRSHYEVVRDLVWGAMLEENVAVYHDESGSTYKYAEAAAKKICEL